MPSFFPSTAKGMEGMLLDELKALGADSLRETRAGVYFEAELATAYRVCLWSRLANTVYLPLLKFKAVDGETIYKEVMAIDWLEHLSSSGSFRIDVDGKHSTITHPHFIAHKIKDAIVDQIRQKTNKRPDIELEQPDIVLHAFIKGSEFTLSLDLAGTSLHRRGYRVDTGKAPLKETLACAILIRAGWLQMLDQDQAVLFDPMCGSGTLPIEAAMMAYDIAPGLNRPYFGFLKWRQHDKKAWESLLEEAKSRKEKGLLKSNIIIVGSDSHTEAVKRAIGNARRADLQDKIAISLNLAERIRPPAQSGLMVCNPPYGERLLPGEFETISELFNQLGKQLKQHFLGWEAAIFTGLPDSVKTIGIRPSKIYHLFNGPIECELLKFKIDSISFWQSHSPLEKIIHQAKQKQAEGLSSQGQMLFNRLIKNQKKLAGFLKKDNISCYRLYDADMPEFAVAVDIYEQFAHIQEYQAPKEIDPKVAYGRLVEAVLAVQLASKLPFENLFVKIRQRQKGLNQYEKLSEVGEDHIVHEGVARFYVNFSKYLDTGLFLDHRPMRKMVAEASKGKSLLNLFSYTCTASVQAALAGAKKVVSVDLSNTYLNWGIRNFELNHIDLKKHEFIQADCMQWLLEAKSKFDVIFIDPPSFSNSKRMKDVFDIQTDHVKLIEMAAKLLNPKGCIYFSTNLRSFKINDELNQKFKLSNISRQSIPEDFFKDYSIHRSWHISLD